MGKYGIAHIYIWWRAPSECWGVLASTPLDVSVGLRSRAAPSQADRAPFNGYVVDSEEASAS